MAAMTKKCRFCNGIMNEFLGESDREGISYDYRCTNKDCPWCYRESVNFRTLRLTESWYRTVAFDMEELKYR